MLPINEVFDEIGRLIPEWYRHPKNYANLHRFYRVRIDDWLSCVKCNCRLFFIVYQEAQVKRKRKYFLSYIACNKCGMEVDLSESVLHDLRNTVPLGQMIMVAKGGAVQWIYT